VLEKAAQTVVDASIDSSNGSRRDRAESGKTRALPEIWSKPDDFTAAQKLLTERAPKLLAAVKAKDAAGVQAAFGRSVAPARTATIISARPKTSHKVLLG
jgi:cytochrome c556